MTVSQNGQATPRKRASILIVEDNVPLATCLEMLLEAHSYEVSRTADGFGGLESIKLMDFDVILCDLMMPGLTGDRLHSEVRRIKPHLCDRFIFMSGDPDKGKWAKSLASTDRPIFEKPFALTELLKVIEEVVQANPGRNVRSQSSPASVCPRPYHRGWGTSFVKRNLGKSYGNVEVE